MPQPVTLDALAADPVLGDAFGAMLRAVHNGTGGVGAIERDDGRLEPHDAHQYFTGPPEWSALDRQACASATGTVLDVGCGAGRHVLSLQEHGRHAIGIDISAGACEVARERGADDIRHLGLDDVAELGTTVDTILMLGNNLALLGSVEAAAHRLAALAAVAGPRTRILGTNIDPYGSLDPYGGVRPDANARSVPAEHARYHAANRARGRLGGQLRLRGRFEHLADPWFDYLLCSQAELLELLADSPWRLTEFTPVTGGSGYLAELRLR